MDIKQIIGQHGKSVALVFKKLGIKAEVSNKDLMLALVMYKEPLMDAIANQIAIDESYNNLEGDVLPIGQLAQVKANKTAASKEKAQKVKNTLMGIFTTLVTGAGAFIGAKNKAQSTSTVTPVGPVQTIADISKKRNQKYFLIGGIAVITILVIALLTQKNK